MKAFKKLALVTAIAAAPFAQAEMVAIDDALMGEMTGQAGITIELSTEVKIGSIVYSDTDGLDGAAVDTGLLNITGVRLGGSGGVGTALDGIKIDIDVDANDGLVIHLGAKDMAGVLQGTNSVDFGLDVASVSLNSGVNLVSNVNIQGNLGPIDVTIADSGDIDVAAYFEVTNGSLNVDVLGLGITKLTIGDNDSPILAAGSAYKADIDNFIAYAEYGTVAPAQAASTAADAAKVTADDAVANWTDAGSGQDAGGKTLAERTTEASTADTAATNAAATLAGANLAVSSGTVSAGATQGVSNMAYVGMTVTTGVAGYGKLNGSSSADWSADTIAVQSALIVTIDSMKMDIGMDLTMGTATNMTTGDSVSTALGSVAIDNLDLSGTTLAIYGH